MAGQALDRTGNNTPATPGVLLCQRGGLHLRAVEVQWARGIEYILIYPQRAELRRYDGRCLLIYWAQVATLHHLPPYSEISERRVVRVREAEDILGGYWPPQHLMEILKYALAERGK